MQANLPVAAAEDYRTALTYDRENRQYRLRLAQALLAANRFNEARAHLLSLWEQEPADGEANLTLAHLYSRRGNRAEAVRIGTCMCDQGHAIQERKAPICALFLQR